MLVWDATADAQAVFEWNNAANATWTDTKKTHSWTKLSGTSSSTYPQAADTGEFNAATGVTVTLNNNAANTISFGSSAGSFTLSGGRTTFTLGGGGITNNSGSTQTITGSGLTLSLSAASSLAIAGSGGLTISSTSLTLGSNNLTLSGSGSGAGSISAVISGTGGVAESGTGTWTLSGANTYTGSTSLTSGTLIAANAAALGATSTSANISSGAALGLTGGISLSSTTGSASGISAIGSGVGGSGALYNVSGANSYNGNLTLLGDTTVGATAGTLTLGGNVTLDVSATADSTVTFNAASGATINVAGMITDYNSNYALNIAQVGNGLVTLSQAANQYYGNTTVGTAGGTTTGTLQLGVANALPTRNNSSLITIYSGTLDLNNFNATAQGSIRMGGGGAGSTAAITTGTGTLTLNHDVTFDATNNPNGATISGSLALASGTHLFTIGDSTNAAADLTVSANIADGSGPAEIDKYGTGTLVLSGNNSYSSLTTVQQGILNIQSNTALGSTSSGSTVSAGATLQLNGNLTVGDSLILAGTGYGGSGALENATGNSTWTGAITINNTTARLQADSGTMLTLSNNLGSTGSGTLEVGGAGTVNVTGSITSGAAGNIVAVNKKDSGTLILAGSDTFAGPVDVQGGTLSVQNNFGLGTTTTTATVENGASLAFDSTAHGNLNTASGITTINLNGSGVGGAGAMQNTAGTNTYNGAVNVASAATITANAGTSLTIAGNVAGASGIGLTVGTTAQNGNVTISGALNGVNLTKQGAVNAGADGTLTLSGGGSIGTVQLNAGKTVVSASTLNTGNFTAGAGTSLLIAAGATVNVTGDATFASATLDGTSLDAGTLQVNGQHTLTFNGTINAPNLTLTLAGGSVGTNAAPLTVNLTGANVTVGSIVITGDTILDFGNSAGTTLTAGALTLANPNAKVVVKGWVTTAFNTSASTIWYVLSTVNNTTLGTTNQTPTSNSGLGQISFDNPQGSVGNTTTWVADTSSGWFDKEIRPTPEPATYGVIFLSLCLGVAGFFRWQGTRKPRAIS